MSDNSQPKEKLISPYYLHPSENTCQVLTAILFNGSNYEKWAKLMRNSLRTKRKLGFIDGTLKRPSDDSDDAEKWDMVNSMVIGWIYSSIEPKMRSSISIVDSANTMWASIRRRFSISDDTRTHQIHSDIASCKQDGDTVDAYFSKLKMMWDDLADLQAGFKCCCGDASCSAMVKYEETQEKIRVHQFLMGLDSSRFGTARSNLLSRGSTLNLDMVYSQVIQEERHLNAMKKTKERTPTVAFSVDASGSSGSRQSIVQASAAAKPSRSSVTCSHCGKQGHDNANCFQLIGFPEWWPDKSKALTGRGGHSSRGRGGAESGRGRGRSSGFRAYNLLGMS